MPCCFENDLLDRSKRDTLPGRRDYAILLLFCRLGLRAHEVAALELGDVDWVNGKIVVRGKGDRHASLPISAEVGESLAEYVRRERPRTGHQKLFLRVRAP
ncbi:tyrosine-type recombinase/integrase, partial [Candidatus Acetothermia bacterium]|nr:tyrosine-type recombinase/integrase [Candidatus Acetothermia bacterium]